MNKKHFAGTITLAAVAAGCIFLTGSAMAAEQTQITLDPAVIQQALDRAEKTVRTKQAHSIPASANLQQQMQKTPTEQLAGTQLDPAVQQNVNEKMLNMMKETMQETFSNPEIMQEMQKKAMSEQMNSNLLQESMQPMIMNGMRGSIQNGVKQ